MKKEEIAKQERKTKKDYSAPQLVEYGNLAVLTQGMAGSVNDGMSGLEMAMGMP